MRAIFDRDVRLRIHTSPCELKNVTSPNLSVFAVKAHINFVDLCLISAPDPGEFWAKVDRRGNHRRWAWGDIGQNPVQIVHGHIIVFIIFAACRIWT